VWRYLCPKQYAQSTQQIDLNNLKKKGIKGIIMDLDNTLVPWNDNAVVPEVIKWIEEVKKSGFQACIVSNNKARRREEITKVFDVPTFWKAVKPRRRTFRKAIKMMGLKPSQVAVIGDQVFTDILGGNRLGLYTILVHPINKREYIGTMCVRKIEKVVLFGLRRKGYLKR
jgi:HAD superfamily phosphatase (TIGR01668 family)